MFGKREKLVLIELLKHGRKPDKLIARSLGLSQPTVTRIRHRLETRGIINGYQAMVELPKFDLKLVAITNFKILNYGTWEKLKNDLYESVSEKREIVTLAFGEGFGGKNGLFVSIHKDFIDYSSMVLEIKKHYGEFISDIDHFLIPFDGLEKRFALNDAVIDHLKKIEAV